VTAQLASNSPVTSSDRRPDIQGLRAIAVFVVVCFHAGLSVHGGFAGVDIFFVISGFVITAMLAREWQRSGTLRFRSFYARRFRRLTPALAVLVLVIIVISALVQSPLGAQQITAQTGIGALLLAANIVIAKNTGGYFDAPAASNPLLNTWSLSVEEQFYLLFPLLLFIGWVLMRRLRGNRIPPIAIVTIVGLLSFAITMVQATGHRIPLLPHWLIGFYGPVTRVWEFAAGAFLALLLTGGARALRPVFAFALGLLGLAGLIATMWLVTGDTVWPGPMTVLPVVSTMLLIYAGTSANAVSRLLATRPFVSVGNISYSWYLWHWPLIVFALLLWPSVPGIAVIAAVASLVPALLSYRYVEQPIRNLRSVSVPRMVRIITVTLVPPIALSLLLLTAANNGFWNSTIRDFSASVTPMHIGNAAGCNKSRAFDSPKARPCIWNAEAAGSTIYLVGDSHADHLGEGIIAAAESTGHPVRIATANSCPFYDTFLKSTAEPHSPCRAFVQDTLAYLEKQPPGIVVISSSSVYWNSRVFSAGTTPDSMTRDRAAKREALTAGLESSVKRLQASGHQVVLVQDVPYFSKPLTSDPQQFSALSIASGSDLAVTMPLSDANANEAAARQAFTDVAKRDGALLIDLRDFFCPDGLCTTELDGMYLYRDDGHISIAASRALAGTFTQAFASLPASAQ
jgi:peptidoglycan/LPS O-acetylase OafA/YrhL